MKVTQNLILREIAGEYIVIPTGETALKVHGMITLTESGALLLKKLQTGADRQALVQAILAEYDIDADTAARDVDAFLQKMDAVGILEA